jgi:hypothetical protein
MLKSDLGDNTHVKCIVCIIVKGKDVILGPKFDMLDKHARKTKVVQDMPHLGRRKGSFM